MHFKHDWKFEVIAQFITTLLIEKDNIRKMHMMTKGKPYFVKYYCFITTLLGFSPHDFMGRTHNEKATPLGNISKVYALSSSTSSKHCHYFSIEPDNHLNIVW